MLNFQRMEKLEFGGLKGRMYNEQVAKMCHEFRNHCHVLEHSGTNPLDLTSQVRPSISLGFTG